MLACDHNEINLDCFHSLIRFQIPARLATSWLAYLRRRAESCLIPSLQVTGLARGILPLTRWTRSYLSSQGICLGARSGPFRVRFILSPSQLHRFFCLFVCLYTNTFYSWEIFLMSKSNTSKWDCLMTLVIFLQCYNFSNLI